MSKPESINPDELIRRSGGSDRRAVFARYGARPSFSKSELIIRYILFALALLTVGVTMSIIAVLMIDAMRFFSFDDASFVGFFTGLKWEPFAHPKKLGVLPLLWGTMIVAVGSCIVAIPLGMGTAIYLTQFAGHRLRNVIMPVVEILGGVPTVVYGYFALKSVTPFLRNYIDLDVYNALSASIVVGIAILPMISSLSMDALQSVPKSISNAGYALGMRKFHVTTRIVVPAALSGIVASFILAFSRAVGETMAVTLAGGQTPNIAWMKVAGIPLIPDYTQSIETMTAYIVQISLGDTPHGSIEYYTIYVIGLTLFAITFAFNYLASRIVRRFREAY